MPNYNEVVRVKPTQTFPYELYQEDSTCNRFKFYFIKDKEVEVETSIAEELLAKRLVERVISPVINKAEGPSINADSDYGSGKRTRNAARA